MKLNEQNEHNNGMWCACAAGIFILSDECVTTMSSSWWECLSNDSVYISTKIKTKEIFFYSIRMLQSQIYWLCLVWFSQIISYYSSCSRICAEVQTKNAHLPTDKQPNLFNVSESTPKTTRILFQNGNRLPREPDTNSFVRCFNEMNTTPSVSNAEFFFFLCFVIVRITVQMKNGNWKEKRSERYLCIQRTIATAMFATNFKNSIRHPVKSARMFVYRRKWCVQVFGRRSFTNK